MTTTVSPLSYSIATASAATGLSRSHLRTAIGSAELKARRSSRNDDGDPQGNWVILAADLQAYLDSLPEG